MVCVCVLVYMQNPIIMDIPVELPQVKVKVLHISCQEPGEVDCIEEGSDQSGSEVDKSIDVRSLCNCMVHNRYKIPKALL